MLIPSEHRYIGLMTGTSLDGLDIALVTAAPFQLLQTEGVAFPSDFRQRMKAVASNPDVSLRLAMQAEQSLMALTADAVLAFLAKQGLQPSDIRAIGYHGQTVYHMPQDGISLQLADPGGLAVRTGIPVVGDFRRMDVAAGGEGAPLVPAFHKAVFAQPGRDVAILNLGGIANLTLLYADGHCEGFDTGPANTLINDLAERLTGNPIDEDGRRAAAGKPLTPLLEQALQDAYFLRTPPKSTGREYFSLDWLQQYDPDLMAHCTEDLLHTAAALTAGSLCQALQQRMPGCQQLWVCGGGVHNKTLMAMIRDQMAPVPVGPTDDAGLPGDWVEAAAFAWLAYAREQGLAGNLPSVTGAAQPLVLGGLYDPRCKV